MRELNHRLLFRNFKNLLAIFRFSHLVSTTDVPQARPCNHDITDIYDGEGYREFAQFLSHSSHVSLMLNTDGVALYRSSNVSIWPIWGVVNELPATLRLVLLLCI